MVFDAMARHRSGPVLAAKSFRKTIKQHADTVLAGARNMADDVAQGRFPTLKEATRWHIEEALRRAGGNQGTAAAMLGMSRPALNRRLARMQDE